MDIKTTYVIRKFRPEDIHGIMEIEKQAFPKTAYSKDILLHYAGVLADGFIIAERQQDILGYILFESNGHIISTAVKKRDRRRGLGRMLVEYAVKHTVKPLWLEVRSRNHGAVAFYKSLGMGYVGRIPNYYGNDDALIMKMGTQAL